MAFGFVVRAKTEGGARLVASKYGGDELKELANVDPWLDPAFSSCEELRGLFSRRTKNNAFDSGKWIIHLRQVV